MAQYVLTCCSTVDLTKQHLDGRRIPYVCFHFQLDGREYPDDLGESMSPEELFRHMEQGADTKTSQVSVQEYIGFFEPFLQQGSDILHITLSSGISGTYNSACVAAEEMASRYPDRKIYVVDSLAASSGYGLLIDTMADLRDQGMKIEELREWVLANRLDLHHWFFTTNLKYLIKGGRVSKTAGAIGSLLHICPLMNVDVNGRLTVREKIRGKQVVFRRVVEKMKQHATGGTDYNGKCYICQSLCEEDARTVAELIEKTFPKLDGPVHMFPIGTTIGSHTGPGTIAVFFWGDERQD